MVKHHGNEKDETGHRYGKLTVLGRSKDRNGDRITWNCVCDCGRKLAVSGADLRSGNRRKHCGCARGTNIHNAKKGNFYGKDETGKRYGRWKVLKRVGPGGRFLCVCDCGTVHSGVSGGVLRGGNSQSCGCLHEENRLKAISKPPGESAFNALFGNYRNSAKLRGLSFRLNKEQVRGLNQQNCFYCGALPAQITKGRIGDYTYNGIDRLDSTKGYTVKNCVAACHTCNMMKSSSTVLKFFERCKKNSKYKKILEHQMSKP